MNRIVNVEDLEIGMFVAELDRPWLDTPFLFQGFLIETQDEIVELRRYCRYVLIDPLRSVGFEGRWPEAAPASARHGIPPTVADSMSARVDAALGLDASDRAEWHSTYPDQLSLEDEMPRARKAHVSAQEVVQTLYDALSRRESIDLDLARETMDGMVESIIRNPDALLLLSQIKKASAYVYGRSVSVAIHLLAFGRHLGLPREQLNRLGTGGLLLDVGTIGLPAELIDRRGRLTEAEYATVQRHVAQGLDLLRQSHGLEPDVLAMVAGHHEREDGSGYPAGLAGAAITLPAKMAGIVDTYDALISERPYAAAASPYEALQRLYAWRGRLFHAELVEHFIQCLQIYPVGSLVELNSGEVAVVLGHNRVRRLKPRLLIVLDRAKQPYRAPQVLDLLTAPPLPDGRSVEIVRALEHGMYGIDPRDYYLA